MLGPAQLQRARLPGEEAPAADAQAALLPRRRMGLVRRLHRRRRADTEPRTATGIWRPLTHRTVAVRHLHLQDRR